MSIRPAFAELTSPRSKLPMQSVTARWRRSLLLLRRTARGYRCCSPQFAASGHGSPQIIAVDEAAAIAKRYPLLETLDIPKGTFDGSLPAPDDDITTLSVSYRLLACAAMPDWVAPRSPGGTAGVLMLLPGWPVLVNRRSVTSDVTVAPTGRASSGSSL